MSIDFVTIPTWVLQDPNLCDKQKMLLGLIIGFNSKGFRMGNNEVGEILMLNPKTVSNLMSDLKSKGYIKIDNPQSRYRKIYFHKNIEVETTTLPQKEGSKDILLPQDRELLPQIQGFTSTKTLPIKEGIELKNKTPTAEAVELASFLLGRILARKPDFRKPNTPAWAIHIDRMLSIDHRTPDTIRAVIEWTQQDSFEQKNVLCTEKLRERFDQLEMKMQKSSPPIKMQRPKVCFYDRQPATRQIKTGRGQQFICDDCFRHLEAAPLFKTFRGQIIPKANLEPSTIEDMILKQKAKSGLRIAREPVESMAI